jgi:hypothetical protein
MFRNLTRAIYMYIYMYIYIYIYVCMQCEVCKFMLVCYCVRYKDLTISSKMNL